MASKFLLENPISQYPPVLSRMTAIQDLSNAEYELYKDTYKRIENIENNAFFLTADEETVKRYESVINIISGADESLEFRRARLQNRYNLNKRYTIRCYCEKMNELIGHGKWNATLNSKRTLLTVVTSAKTADWTIELLETINRMKPVRLNVLFLTKTQSKIGISAAVEKRNVRYSFLLGSSKLGNDTLGQEYEDFKNIGGIGMITQSELNKTADFIMQNINKVLVNDLSEINQFTLKNTNNNIVQVEYIIPSTIEHIDNIKLIDVDGDVIEELNVNVELTDNLLMKHNIVVEEATE